MSEERNIAYLVRDLQRDPIFAEFRRRILETRIEQLQAGFVRPAKGFEDVFQQERDKGAFIALKALLRLVDTKLPLPKDDDPDAADQ